MGLYFMSMLECVGMLYVYERVSVCVRVRMFSAFSAMTLQRIEPLLASWDIWYGGERSSEMCGNSKIVSTAALRLRFGGHTKWLGIARASVCVYVSYWNWNGWTTCRLFSTSCLTQKPLITKGKREEEAQKKRRRNKAKCVLHMCDSHRSCSFSLSMGKHTRHTNYHI